MIPRTVVTLGFDDGTADHWHTVRPILDRHDVRAVFFIISGRLNRTGHMTGEQVRALYDEGHEIGGHTVNHVHLPQLTYPEQGEEIGQDRRNLIALGVDPVSFAYPFGEWTPETAALVSAAGYRTARAVGGINPGDRANLPAAIGLPVQRGLLARFTLPTPGSVRRHHTLADLQGLVERAEEFGGNLQLVFHRVDYSEPVYGVAPEILDAFLGGLAGRDGTTVATTRDFMGGDLETHHPLPADLYAGRSATTRPDDVDQLISRRLGAHHPLPAAKAPRPGDAGPYQM